MIYGLSLLEQDLTRVIGDSLDRIGLHYRIFSRSKDSKSIREKIERKRDEGVPYSKSGKKIQDLIGVRVVTYFRDDVDLVKEILSHVLNFSNEEIDSPKSTVFSPKRTNIVCSLNSNQKSTFLESIRSAGYEFADIVDATFELQLRTVLSEGWHEIDHSLRYKCKSDWQGYYENERLLNGIYASLETNDIALKNLFNELAYQHFKNRNWEGLLRNKYRLRFIMSSLKTELIEILNEDPKIGKSLFKLDRAESLLKFYDLSVSTPMTLSNLLFTLNALYMKDERILQLTPPVIMREVGQVEEKM